MRAILLSAASAASIAAPGFNTNAGSKLFICTTPQQSDVNETAAAALTWVQIKGVGSLGETGTSTNILTYDTWDTKVVQKAKGMSNAGDPDIELARIPTDAGQMALRAAARTNLNYMFKVERNDLPDTDPDSKPTTLFYRGLVVGPKRPNGRNEDFDLEVFSLGLNQEEILVDPIAG